MTISLKFKAQFFTFFCIITYQTIVHYDFVLQFNILKKWISLLIWIKIEVRFMVISILVSKFKVIKKTIHINNICFLELNLYTINVLSSCIILKTVLSIVNDGQFHKFTFAKIPHLYIFTHWLLFSGFKEDVTQDSNYIYSHFVPYIIKTS